MGTPEQHVDDAPIEATGRPDRALTTHQMAELEDLLATLVLTSNRLVRLAVYAIGDSETPTRWRTLSVLEAYGSLRLGELATRSRVSQPTMTKAVGRLIPKGYIERIADPTDARATVLRITPAGSQALADWCAKLSQALLPYFETISGAEFTALRDAMTLLNERVEYGISHEKTPTPTTDGAPVD